MDTTIQTLEQLGIDDKQAKVYLAALELGSATVQELAEKSGIKRTSIYNFLEEMKQLGLLTEIEEGRHSLLIAEDPNVLLQRANQQVQNITKLLPNLMGVFNLPGNKPKVRYYKGIEGIKNAWIDIIATKETIYSFSDYEKMFKAMPDEWAWNIPEQRVENKIFFYCVAKDGPWGRKVKKKDKQQMRETRLIKNINFETEVNIYGNKVMMLSFRRPYAAVIIEDRAIALTMKTVWELVWASQNN